MPFKRRAFPLKREWLVVQIHPCPLWPSSSVGPQGTCAVAMPYMESINPKGLKVAGSSPASATNKSSGVAPQRIRMLEEFRNLFNRLCP